MSGPGLTDQERVEAACEVMHDAYETAAVTAGWETQERSRKPWSEVPEANKATMRVAVSALLDWLTARGVLSVQADDDLRARLLTTARDKAGSPVTPGCAGFTERAFWLRFADEVAALAASPAPTKHREGS